MRIDVITLFPEMIDNAAAHGITFELSLPASRYPETQQRTSMIHEASVPFLAQTLINLRAIPGVEAAALGKPLPLSGGNAMVTFQIDGHPVPKSEAPSADVEVASPGFFNTLNIPLLRGRDFSERDDSKAPGVIVVNEAFAHKYFPNEDALGKHITPSASNSGKPAPREIIAVVGNVKNRSLDTEDVPIYYIASTQLNFGSMAVCLRTSNDPHSAVKTATPKPPPDLSASMARS